MQMTLNVPPGVSTLPTDAAIPCARPPVIILGMHRSGTSMVAKLLDQLGLFVGRRLQVDHESTFFLEMNDRVLARISASWDHPEPIRDFLACEPAMRMTALALRGDLMSRRAGRFFNSRLWEMPRSFEHFDGPWGWKDPRTVFTLPLWLRLFPDARLVYIVRHGVDVAASLMVRERRLLRRRQERFISRMAKMSLRSCVERVGFKGSPRCLTLDGAFSLWTEYLQQGDDVLAKVPNPVHMLRYEDFLAEPAKHLSELVAFCGLDGVGGDAVERAAGEVDGSRARAYEANSELARFYDQIRFNSWMRRFGY